MGNSMAHGGVLLTLLSAVGVVKHTPQLHTKQRQDATNGYSIGRQMIRRRA